MNEKRISSDTPMLQSLSKFPQIIRTPRLTLQVIAPTKTNAEILFDIIDQNRNYLMNWQGHFGALRNVDNVVDYLVKRQDQIKTNQGVCFYIFLNNNIIGRIRFFDIKDNSCEIGYWLIQSANGYGYMTEALSALESELFKFGFDNIILDIDDGNTRSENVVKRAKYKLTKRLPMASYAKCVGKCDSLIYVKHKGLNKKRFKISLA